MTNMKSWGRTLELEGRLGDALVAFGTAEAYDYMEKFTWNLVERCLIDGK